MASLTAQNKERAIFIDFLRGLSVFGILCYHLVPGTPVGIGQGSMEFFFVISGYLITKTFTKRLAGGFYGLKDFASSRIRRLLPALCLYLAFVALINLIKGETLWLVSQSALWTLAGFYNWFQIYSTDTICGLGGIWSLSVEDQYYYIMLILGMLVIVTKTNQIRRAFFMFYLCMAGVSIAARAYNAVVDPDSIAFVSYNTLSRLWGFSIGGLVALGSSALIARSSRNKMNQRLVLLLVVSLLVAAYILLLTVEQYAAKAFLQGWLLSPVFLGFSVLAATYSENQKHLSNDSFPSESRRPNLLPWHLRNCGLINWMFVFVAKMGVACYPIYLFQESDRLVGINVHWTFSIVWALAAGFLVHNIWERRFYAFPRYAFLSTQKARELKDS